MLIEALKDNAFDYPLDSDRLKEDLQVLVDHADKQLVRGLYQHSLRVVDHG